MTTLASSMRRSFGTMVLIFEGFILIEYLFSAGHFWDGLCPCEIVSSFYLTFLLAFWTTYFLGGCFQLGTLRMFLDQHTYRLDPSVKNLKEECRREGEVFTTPAIENKTLEDRANEVIKARNAAVLARSAVSITSQGTFMAVIAFFLWPVVNPPNSLDLYQSYMQTLVIGLGLLTILFMLWSVDLLDTIQNVFRGSEEKVLITRAYFFRRLGWAPQGGASYRYYGFACLTAFLISAVSFFKPYFSGPAVTVFCYLGFPILFGYTTEEVKKNAGEPKSGTPETANQPGYRVELGETESRKVPILLFLLAFALSIYLCITSSKEPASGSPTPAVLTTHH